MPTNLIAHTDLTALETRFKSAYHFLKTTKINSRKLIKHPWYLVIGSAGCGKTSLLTQCGLKFLDAKHLTSEANDENSATKHINFRFSPEATLLDIPGEPAVGWLAFINVLKKYIKHKPPSALMLTIDLTTFSPHKKIEQQAQTKHLKELCGLFFKQLKTTCPIYLVLTKADQLLGFKEFFSDLGHEEQTQTWGVDLPNNLSINSSLTSVFKTQFDRLLKRLNERLIWRLQQERNLQKRILIQNFPLQIENLKNGLVDFIYQQSDIFNIQNHNLLQGVYLTSSLQDGTLIDTVHKSVAQTLLLPPEHHTPNHFSHQQSAYFIQQLFKNILAKKILPRKIRIKNANHDNKRYLLTCVFAAGVMFTGGTLMAKSFNNSIVNISSAQAALAQYSLLRQQINPNTAHDLSQILPALNSLQKASEALQQVHLPWLLTHSMHQENLPALATKTYHDALVSYFLPSLGVLLQQPLNNSTDPAILYSALKTYLMLGDPSHLDNTYVNTWLKNYWQRNLPNNPALQKQLTTHLAALLAQPFAPLELNQQSIANTRNQLFAASASELAYAILKDNVNNLAVSHPPFNNDETVAFAKVFTSNQSLNIPNIYTAAQFQSIYFDKTRIATTAALNGDWVLGSIPTDLQDSRLKISEPALNKQVQTLYLTNYSNFWQTWLNNIRITPWQTWGQGEESLNALLGSKSPLVSVLRLVSANTQLGALLPASSTISTDDAENVNDNLSSQFEDINNLLPTSPTPASHSLDQLLLQITNLHDYLQGISGAANADKAAFNAAKESFARTASTNPMQTLHDKAATLPAPLQTWFTGLTMNAWGLVLNHAAQYLNEAWQSQVVPFYNSRLVNRYPLLKNAKQDVDPNDFTTFFKPDGMLDSYFKNYLSAFIDSTQVQWQWRTLNGLGLTTNPQILAQMERAKIMQTMYFTDDGKLSVDFVLRATTMEPGVQSFTLRLNDQTFTDSPDKISLHKLNWTNTADSPQVASLAFTDTQGHQINANETGPWAIFRLLDKTNLHPTQNSQNFNLTFDLNGNAAFYQLEAAKMVNAFIPDVTDQFRLPSSLK